MYFHNNIYKDSNKLNLFKFILLIQNSIRLRSIKVILRLIDISLIILTLYQISPVSSVGRTSHHLWNQTVKTRVQFLHWVNKFFFFLTESKFLLQFLKIKIQPLELGMPTVGHGRSTVSHGRSKTFDRPTTGLTASLTAV